MLTLVDVKTVADFLGVSTRRVRVLLEQRRLPGYKDRGIWRVIWPITVKPGRRGPDLKGYPARKIAETLSGLYKAHRKAAKPSKGGK